VSRIKMRICSWSKKAISIITRLAASVGDLIWYFSSGYLSPMQ
jgi:hypothetical protein